MVPIRGLGFQNMQFVPLTFTVESSNEKKAVVHEGAVNLCVKSFVGWCTIESTKMDETDSCFIFLTF